MSMWRRLLVLVVLCLMFGALGTAIYYAVYGVGGFRQGGTIFFGGSTFCLLSVFIYLIAPKRA